MPSAKACTLRWWGFSASAGSNPIPRALRTRKLTASVLHSVPPQGCRRRRPGLPASIKAGCRPREDQESQHVRHRPRSLGSDAPAHRHEAGDARLRSLLDEAATVILTRVRTTSTLRSWGLALRKKVGYKRAAVAVARKLAVILHAMWKSGMDFAAA